MNVVHVAVFTSLNKTLYYANYDKSSVGDLVEVTVRNRKYNAVVIEILEVKEKKEYKYKEIEKIVIKNFFNTAFINFVKHFASYNISNLGDVFDLSISKGIENAVNVKIKDKTYLLSDIQRKKLLLNSPETHITHELFDRHEANNTQAITTNNLNENQLSVFNEIQKNLDTHKIDLIYGVTGSGKTEVFLHLINRILSENPNGQVLVLLPEVMLVENLIQKIKNRINIEFIVWHSGVHKRKNDIVDIVTGKVKLIFGTRSAMMLKYKNLSGIIIDEEHDDSYKQSEGIFYHARDMSVLRGFYEKFPIFLFSATPSIESLYNVWQKKYNFFKLENRFFESRLPKFNFSGTPSQTLLSENAINVIKENIKNGFQTMFFVNKRGYARFLVCNTCGQKEMCESCDFALCYHKIKNKMKCHHCGAIKNISKCCMHCQNDMSLINLTGIESYAESLEQRTFFGNKLKIVVISSDIINSKSKMQETINFITQEDCHVIFGTKMLAKGFHFPKLKSVIVIDENLKNEEDFRGDERLMQIITQVAGRAGREMKDGGEVFIESNKINQKMKEFIAQNDYLSFAKYELNRRYSSNSIFCNPPFVKEIDILLASDDKLSLANFEKHIAHRLQIFIKQYQSQFKMLKFFGPVEYFVSYVKKRHRSKFIIRCDKTKNIQALLVEFEKTLQIPPKTNIRFEVNAR